jgi:hypothetical protein
MFSQQRQGEPPHVAVEPGWRVTVERHMNKSALLFGVGASLILAGAGTASAAGSCGAQVAELQQKLGMEEGSNATIGATDPGVQQPSPQANATTGTSTDSSTGTSTTTGDTSTNTTIGATDPGVQQPQDMDPTDNADASGSTGTSTMPPSGDVTETSRVGDMNTAAGGRAEAITALKKAQMAADAGDEDTCMTELGTAKAAMGVQ